MANAEFQDPEHDDEMVAVTLPSNAMFQVHLKEKEYFEDRVRRYMEDNLFTNVSDMQDLDRVMIGEVLIWRWGGWLMSQKNYWGEAIDDATLQKSIKELSAELRQVKAALALDKVARDRQKGEDSVSAYIKNMGIRAKFFDYKRNQEFHKIMEIFHDLKAMITFHDNCDEDERRERRVTIDHIMNWLRDTAFPEYEKIDEHFRREGPNAQRGWIQNQ